MKIGDYANDGISGIEGDVVSRTEHLYGPPEICVLRHGLDADGKPWEGFWFPEARALAAERP